MVKPPDPNQGFNTISSILGVAQQQQNLQTGQYLQQTARAKAIQDQQAATENQAGARILADPIGNGILEADGKTPTKNALSIYMRTMPTQGAGKYSDFVTAAQHGVEFNNARMNLNLNERQAYNSAVAGYSAGAQSPEDVRTGMDTFMSGLKGSPVYDDFQTINDVFSKGFEHKVQQPTIPGKTEPWRQFGLDYGRSVLGAPQTVGAGGIGAGTTGTVDTGKRVQPIVQAPAAQGGGITQATGAVDRQIPPGTQQSLVEDPQTHTFNWVTKDQSGNVVDVRPASSGMPPRSGGPSQPRVAPSPGPPKPQPSAFQGPGAAQIMENVEGARVVGDQAGSARNVNKHLLELSANTKTGPGTQIWHDFLGTIGAPFGGSPSADYQAIGAYLDRQAALSARTLGVPNTNAGLATAERASGTTDYSPPALQEKVKFTDALNSGAMAFRKGLDKVVGTGQTPDLSKYQAFRSAWAQNFDPDVFRMEDAQRRNDTAEQAAILKRVGAKGAADLARKSANLRLLENGQIP